MHHITEVKCIMTSHWDHQKLTSWNSLRRSYAFCMPLSTQRERIDGRSCRNTLVSTIPCDPMADRVSKAIMVSPCAWFVGSPHGICSFSLASTSTRTPVMTAIGGTMEKREYYEWLSIVWCCVLTKFNMMLFSSLTKQTTLDPKHLDNCIIFFKFHQRFIIYLPQYKTMGLYERMHYNCAVAH